MHRKKLVVRTLAALCMAGATLSVGPVGVSQGETGFAFPFTCNRDSLTADFAGRDGLPQTHEPAADWYRTNDEGHYLNRGWGPTAEAFPAPTIPADAGCDETTWKQERILSVAMRYIYSPDNPLGLQYRHHHIPGWDPSTSTYAGAPEVNPDNDAPSEPIAWASGEGLDCSNFTAWVYNYGLGIKFNGDVEQQNTGAAGPMGERIPASGPFEPGDLVYLHPDGNPNVASHVVIYVDDQHIIDSRINIQNLVGVQVRNRVGWYREAVLGAWRPIA